MTLALLALCASALGSSAHRLDDMLQSSERNLRESRTQEPLSYDVGTDGSVLGARPTGTNKNFDNIDATLRELEEKTKAEINLDSSSPSSLLESDIDKQMARIENAAYLEAIQKARANEKAKHPTSFLEESEKESATNVFQKEFPDSYAEVQSSMNKIRKRTNGQIAKMTADIRKFRPSSFVEESNDTPESFADMHTELLEMKQKANAELAQLHKKLHWAAPSSLLEEPGRFDALEKMAARFDEHAKEGAVEESKAADALAKLNATYTKYGDVEYETATDAAGPSSLLEQGIMPESFSDLDAELAAARKRTQDQIRELAHEVNQPTIRESLLERRVPATLEAAKNSIKALEQKAQETIKGLYPLTAPAKPSSFVEEGAPDSFADLDAKLKALEEKTKAELAKLQSDTSAPQS